MTPQPYAREQEAAILAIREAVSFCREIQDHLPLPALEKEDRSPVTSADLGSQALICRALAAAFPGDPIVAEEAASSLETPEGTHVLDDVVERVRRIRPEAGRADVLGWIERGNSRISSHRFWALDLLGPSTSRTSGFGRFC